MAWFIPSYQDLGTHPKLKRMARLLGIPNVMAAGHLHYLWWWAMDYAQDGDLSRWEPADIADAAQWEGDPDLFFVALRDCGGTKGNGFVDVDEDGSRLHDWDQYGGKVLQCKKADADRKRQERERRKASIGCPPDVQRKSALREDKIREEKIREEKKQRAPTNLKVQTLDGQPLPLPDGQAYGLYIDSHAGRISDIEADYLRDMVREYSEEWVAESIREAVKSGRSCPSIKYLTVILDRWRRDGFKAAVKGNGKHGSNRGNPATTGEGGGQQDSGDRYAYTRELLRKQGRLPAGGTGPT